MFLKIDKKFRHYVLWNGNPHVSLLYLALEFLYNGNYFSFKSHFNVFNWVLLFGKTTNNKCDRFHFLNSQLKTLHLSHTIRKSNRFGLTYLKKYFFVCFRRAVLLLTCLQPISSIFVQTFFLNFGQKSSKSFLKDDRHTTTR